MKMAKPTGQYKVIKCPTILIVGFDTDKIYCGV